MEMVERLTNMCEQVPRHPRDDEGNKRPNDFFESLSHEYSLIKKEDADLSYSHAWQPNQLACPVYLNSVTREAVHLREYKITFANIVWVSSKTGYPLGKNCVCPPRLPNFASETV